MKFELHKGDCLELMRSLPDASVDMVLCDLPYGTTACKWDSVIPFEPLWAEYRRVAKKNAAIVLTASQPFTSALVSSNLPMFKYGWVWEKTKSTGFANAKKQPLRSHEDVLVFYCSQPTYNPQGVRELDKPKKQPKMVGEYLGRTGFKDGYLQTATGYPKTVLKVPNPTNSNVHPTQKPVALMEYLIRTYTNEGDTVLDNTMGSGTTGVACANTGRRFVGMEMDAGYFEIASKRVAEAFSIVAANDNEPTTGDLFDCANG